MNPVDEYGLYGMYPIWYKPFWQTTPFYIVVGVCIAGLLSAVVWFAYKKWQSRVIVRTSWEQALFELTALDTHALETIEQRKQFYTDIVHILKVYLEKRYGQSLLGKTDSELVKVLEGGSFPDYVIENMRSILQGSLTIRFANDDVAQQQVERDMLLCLQMIKQTIPDKKKA